MPTRMKALNHLSTFQSESLVFCFVVLGVLLDADIFFVHAKPSSYLAFLQEEEPCPH